MYSVRPLNVFSITSYRLCRLLETRGLDVQWLMASDSGRGVGWLGVGLAAGWLAAGIVGWLTGCLDWLNG